MYAVVWILFAAYYLISGLRLITPAGLERFRALDDARARRLADQHTGRFVPWPLGGRSRTRSARRQGQLGSVAAGAGCCDEEATL